MSINCLNPHRLRIIVKIIKNIFLIKVFIYKGFGDCEKKIKNILKKSLTSYLAYGNIGHD